MKKTLLLIDAAFLGLAGVFGVTSDLLSYFAGRGPFGEIFYKNSIVINGVEAHLFAVMTAFFMWRFSKTENSDLGNWLGIIAHLICGISNFIWFDVFSAVNAVGQGLVVTIFHFLFVVLNVVLIYKSSNAGLAANFAERKS